MESKHLKIHEAAGEIAQMQGIDRKRQNRFRQFESVKQQQFVQRDHRDLILILNAGQAPQRMLKCQRIA